MASNSTTDTETTTTENETATVDAAATETPATDTPATGTADTATAGNQATATPASSTSGDTSASETTRETPASEAAAPTPSATTPSAATSSGSFVTGALALVSAGLGLASLTGTSLGDMMRARQELLGQITAATGGQIDQIEALYGSPWHTVAVVNATLAVLAAIVGAVLLGVRGRVAGTPSWVKALALGGTVLGVIGLLVSGGMYLDLFAAAPQLPSMPGLGG